MAYSQYYLSDEAERSALHLAIKDVLAASMLISTVPTSCLLTAHAIQVYGAIKYAFTDSGAVNISLIKNQIKDVATLKYVDTILATAPQGDIESLCKIMVDNYKVRKVEDFCNGVVRDISKTPVSGYELLDRMQKEVLDLSGTERRGFVSFSESFLQTRDVIDTLESTEGGVIGLPTGIKGLDRKTTGFRGSQLIVIGGRPSHGKTEFLLNSLIHMAFEHGKECALFSMEMTVDEINFRIISNLTEIPMWKIRTGNLTDKDIQKIDWLKSRAKDIKIHVNDEGALSPSAIHALVKRMKIERPELAIVAIDYLQLMRGDGRAENRNLEISEITRGLKLLAKDVGIPVIIASQMARRIEQRKSKRPKLSDLRDSGAIEADADIVIFCQRPDSSFEKETDQYVMKLVLEKQRMGPIGTVLATNNASIQKIYQTGAEALDESEWRDDDGDDLPF